MRTEEGNSSKTRYKVQEKPRSRRGFIIMNLLMLQGPIRLRCLLPSPKKEMVVVLMLIVLFVVNVVEITMATLLWARVILITMARVVT